MVKTVEIFYSFQCPYSYLAIDRLLQIESKFDVQVLWQPFSAKAAGQSGGQPNNSQMPSERISYIQQDTVRLAKKMELPLVMANDWPSMEFDPDKSIRGAIVAADLGLIMEYNVKMFDRWWGQGLDPNEQEFFVELCDDLDIDPNEFAGRISTSDVRNRVKGNYRRGRKLGIFETPTLVIDEERYVGLDRLSYAEEKLEELGAKKPNWL